MAKADALTTVVADQHQGRAAGIYSVCSANRLVLEAAMRQAAQGDGHILIEATSNQVDQFGGYTGMTAVDFSAYVAEIASAVGFSSDRIILGGDHLGPNVWQGQAANPAMANALALVESYVAAGFTKIHLDASMPCGDDVVNEHGSLAVDISVERAALMCRACENAAGQEMPVYVIGTEVPVPGGARENLHDLQPTPVAEAIETIDLTRQAFEKYGLHDAWQRVIALVVQPGVEFSDTNVVEYDRDKAEPLSALIADYPNLVYEAHSTDYQPAQALREMVEDGFAILKVGPWLTFALREAVFSLAQMELELLAGSRGATTSDIIAVLECAMLKNPAYWDKHYKGNDAELAFARKYSFSDRIRYYWPQADVQLALGRLMHNLAEVTIPLTLLSQVMPAQYEAVRSGRISNSPHELLIDKIMSVTADYSSATMANR